MFFTSPTLCRNVVILYLQLHFDKHFDGYNIGLKRLLKTEWKEEKM